MTIRLIKPFLILTSKNLACEARITERIRHLKKKSIPNIMHMLNTDTGVMFLINHGIYQNAFFFFFRIHDLPKTSPKVLPSMELN